MGMVGIIRCRGHRWSDPLLDHQTVRGGPKGAVGCYVHQGRRDTRCEGLRGWVGRVSPPPTLPSKWGGAGSQKELGGGVEGKVAGWAATDRLLDGSLVIIVHSKQARW